MSCSFASYKCWGPWGCCYLGFECVNMWLRWCCWFWIKVENWWFILKIGIGLDFETLIFQIINVYIFEKGLLNCGCGSHFKKYYSKYCNFFFFFEKFLSKIVWFFSTILSKFTNFRSFLPCLSENSRYKSLSCAMNLGHLMRWWPCD